MHVQRALPVSERRACKVLDQPRGTQRYMTQEDDEERRLIARLQELVRERPRYGYRFMVAILRREGWRVNRKWGVCCKSRVGVMALCMEISMLPSRT